MKASQTKTMLNQRKIRLIKHLSFSVLLLCLSYVIFIVDPLESIITDQVTMRKGSFIYSLWEKPPLPVIMQVFIFNITNAERFLSGLDKKLKVEEVGPYVYQEILENRNATFHDNGTLSFVPHRYSIPMPERSVGDPRKDIIVSANLPLLGLSSATLDMSTFAALAFSTLAKSTNAKPILNLTVHDYLWGYQDNLVSLANSVLPNYINFDRFGIMDRLFDEGHNVVTMNLPKAIEIMKKKNLEAAKQTFKTLTEEHPPDSPKASEKIRDVEFYDDYDSSDLISGASNIVETRLNLMEEKKHNEIRDFSINTWNGSPGLGQWGYNDNKHDKNSPCNTLKGSYDGTLFPKSITKNEKFKVYRKAFCRTLPITYSHTGKQYGIDALWFKLTDNAFADSIDDPESMCYCTKGKTCMKRGLGNITPCYYNIPASVSLPHFYNSDPSLLNEVEGLKPLKEKHESIIVMQPRLGVPMKVRSRIQLNLMNGETKFNNAVKRFDHLTLPVFWMEIAVEDLTPWLHFILFMAFRFLPVVQITFICLVFVAGISCFAAGLLNFFYFSISSKQSEEFYLRKSIKYTAVFPYIKREMARFEEREREMLRVESA